MVFTRKDGVFMGYVSFRECTIFFLMFGDLSVFCVWAGKSDSSFVFFSHWMRKIYMFQWSPLVPELLWIHLFRNRWINLFRQISPPKSNPKKIWHFPLMKLSRKLRVLTASRDWPIQAAITAKMESTETSVMAGYVGVEPKIGGNPSKWMVYNGKSLLKWMIWGENPLFSETSMCL